MVDFHSFYMFLSGFRPPLQLVQFSLTLSLSSPLLSLSFLLKMSSQSLRDECKALDESREFISWFQRHFPTVPYEVIVAFEG